MDLKETRLRYVLEVKSSGYGGCRGQEGMTRMCRVVSGLVDEVDGGSFICDQEYSKRGAWHTDRACGS